MGRIIFIIVVLMSFNSYSQSIAEMMEKYTVECDQVVVDTIKQYGEVKYQYMPVKDQGGEISHYVISVTDTIWEDPQCPEYKYPIREALELPFYSVNTLGKGSIVEGSTIGLDMTRQVSRDYICYVKNREVDKFSDHFWDWIVKQNRQY